MPKPNHTQHIVINGGKKRGADNPVDENALRIKKQLDALNYTRELKKINAQ